jgi:hypothetical protein
MSNSKGFVHGLQRAFVRERKGKPRDFAHGGREFKAGRLVFLFFASLN